MANKEANFKTYLKMSKLQQNRLLHVGRLKRSKRMRSATRMC